MPKNLAKEFNKFLAKSFLSINQISCGFDPDYGQCYYKFKSDGYVDLSLDVLSRNDTTGSVRISLAHNTIQNGDVMANPDMTFDLVKEDHDWSMYPLSYQNDLVGFYQNVEACPPGRVKALQADLLSFAKLWVGNLLEQGHQYKPEEDNDNA